MKTWLLAIRIRGEVLVLSYESNLKPHPGTAPLTSPGRSARSSSGGGGGGAADIQEVDAAVAAARLAGRLHETSGGGADGSGFGGLGLGVGGGGGSGGGSEYSRRDPDAPPVVPAAIAPTSPFLVDMSREEQINMLLPHLVEHSKRTAMTFVPICPPPECEVRVSRYASHVMSHTL